MFASVKETISISEFFFSLLPGWDVHAGSSGVCRVHSGVSVFTGGDPAQGSRECRRLNSHTNTLSKIHFHPAE